MKKLYRRGTVHPSPPIISDQLSFLPATILTLTAALTPEDREVLAYLLSCSSNNTTPAFINFSGNPRRNTPKSSVAKGDHPPLFDCSCFRCYMSYWVRWDSSPNRQLIHEIIDAFEDWLAQSSKGGKNKKERRNKKNRSGELKNSELMSSGNNELGETESVGESSSSSSSADGVGEEHGDGNEEKGSVRRFVSFIGERIWGAWGQ
ncbi:hypothetical protein L6164_035974 [Bauhinia variegata]|uniref:Uncharacterized protein n=1 Tax=Bauhinia variegata TaxID=167791 RepID=A0ACB9KFN5_BAUVA|nr:hypothetical protein L6164_035974 [Bauhinia variegata]